MPYAIEVTDTFGGEANYCWVKRSRVADLPESITRVTHRRKLISVVRELAGWPVSVRVDVSDFGDGLEIRPRGLLQVAFVSHEEMTLREEFEHYAARAYFACAWADAADEAANGPNLSGKEIMDVMPDEIDPEALTAASDLAAEMEHANGCSLVEMFAIIQSIGDGDRPNTVEMFGHYSAMQHMGHGVGLHDAFGRDVYERIKIPYGESIVLSRDYFAKPKRKPTVYYEAGLPATLIPCAVLGWAKTPIHDVTGGYNVVIRLKRAHGAYACGEVLHVWSRYVVVKAGRRNYHTMVKPAPLPERTEANTRPARV